MQHRITVAILSFLLSCIACLSASTAPPHMGLIVLIDGRELGYDSKNYGPAYIDGPIAFGYDLKKPEFLLVTYSKKGTAEKTEILTRRAIDTFFLQSVRKDGASVLTEITFQGRRLKYRVSTPEFDVAVEKSSSSVSDFLKKDAGMSHPGIK